MDAQYPFASRDDIWRVFEELKELHATQFEQAERIARLERRRDEDARLRSVWGPLSPFPSSVGGTVPTEPVFHTPTDAFKGFDQGHHHGVVTTMGLDNEDEPRRGASRANSVRFDESAIHGYYGQASRSNSELPLRTGSGFGSHPLTERSLSHRSDGRQSSSGHSHHSARTNSLGFETTSRMMSSVGSPLIPPPGLFLLGPVPCIIRCWLTTNFSNDSLLYAAVCSGSYASSLGYRMVQTLGLADQVLDEGDLQYIKLSIYLPEASVHQASSRSSSPEPQVPTLTIRFLVREIDPSDNSIQIVLGSDVLRSHNADVLFSQDKIIMVDDERNKVSIPLVRPEDDSVFKSLSTMSDATRIGRKTRSVQEDIQADTNGHATFGVIGRPVSLSRRATSTSASARESLAESEESRKARPDTQESSTDTDTQKEPKSGVETDAYANGPARVEAAGVWGSWKRDSKSDLNASTAGKASRGRTMKVLRPTKTSTRAAPATTVSSSSGADYAGTSVSQPASTRASPDGTRTSKQWPSNPVGGASAFGWLNTTQPAGRAAMTPK
ncbi:ubiquitin carboxyl-terminal hydrolase 19 [Aspergillus sclerotioniger CBS 115572]|uniref:Ubiquitin carboxyl-terminal hydrolase 19 n=1 Tax=Aspergillus sclerotioniger CBS 115572 TaxID=1450535 RepID=A0A317X3H9_9EURO|nr:ubiquitin carboxyl-terminal hydrolase 19 [Aspergillus sclerotioniger CBS 115572]PWY93194.1 ubiquitin carboxyl-terminal hydrolase 19 [Aspergillus sclerotioniger CBS 115572]